MRRGQSLGSQARELKTFTKFSRLRARPPPSALSSSKSLEIWSNIDIELCKFNKFDSYKCYSSGSDPRIDDKGRWDSIAHRREYLIKLGEKLGYRNSEWGDWYKVSLADFLENQGGYLIDRYRRSPYRLLSSTIPDFDWKPWLFGHAPRNMWDEPHIRREYMEWLGAKLDFKTSDDWYGLTRSKVIENCGQSLLRRYKSLFEMMSALFPEYDFKPWKFVSVPKSYWKEAKNIRTALDALVTIAEVPDVYSIKERHYMENGFIGLIKAYNGSPRAILAAAGYLVDSSGKRILHSTQEGARHFAQSIAQRLNFDSEDLKHWQSITYKDLAKIEATRTLRKHYKKSLFVLLSRAFPDIDWARLKYSDPRAPQLEASDLVLMIKYWESEFGIQNPVEWKRIGPASFKRLKRSNPFPRQGGLRRVLNIVYPDVFTEFPK